MTRALATALTAALVMLASVGATISTAASPKTTVIAVENEVMCVSCGVPLAIAESPQADAERTEIKNLVDQGLTKDEIKNRLVDIYGRRVIAKPDDHGFGLAAYLVPIAVVLAVVAALAYTVPRWRRRRRADDDAGAPGGDSGDLSPEDAGRLEEDLARYGV